MVIEGCSGSLMVKKLGSTRSAMMHYIAASTYIRHDATCMHVCVCERVHAGGWSG